MLDWTTIRKSIVADSSKAVLPPTVKLPMLPRALQQFMELAQDTEADAGELSRIISTDSGLSSELLRHVNSWTVGARRQITSVQQALAMFGIRQTQMYLTMRGLKDAMKSTSSKMIHFQTFWNTNLERALFAREVAKLLDADADLAYTAGMLQDFMLPVITNELYKIYLEFSENREQYGSLACFERDRMGWDHAQAAAQVLHSWHLPDELICCVCLHHQDTFILQDPQLNRSTAAAVAIASLIPDAVRQSVDGISRLIELDRQWDEFDLLKLARIVEADFQSMSSNLQNHFSLIRACTKALKKLAAGHGSSSPVKCP